MVTGTSRTTGSKFLEYNPGAELNENKSGTKDEQKSNK
jgi:hypothetical protein